MNRTTDKQSTKALIDAVVEGMARTKGLDIVEINLQTINHSECDYFIICHGNSSTQVNAIANSVENTVKELTGENVYRKDGYQNKLWVLLDFSHVMVHVFQHDTRQFYDLEHLWADAKLKSIKTDVD